MIIDGKWYAEGSAAFSKARLYIVNQSQYKIELENSSLLTGELDNIDIGDRLGNIERKITLEDGSIFATLDNDAIDTIFRGKVKTNSFIHTLESKFRWALIALAITILTTFSFFKWGVPWSSKQIAHALPEKTNKLISISTLDFLDKVLFNKTKLNKEEMEKIRQHFKTTIVPLNTENKKIQYRLHFRSWSDGNISIPNALALPSGDIILTDKFVRLCQTKEEMDAVLLHEMGHVVHRHTLEMVIEGTFVSVAVMMIAGDSSGFADMGVGLGSALVSSAYSRDHESEADMYAFTHMLKAHIDPIAFSKIMHRMTEYMEEQMKSKKTKTDKSIQDNSMKKSKDTILDYFASHPNTERRINVANQFSECYKKGLIHCDIKLKEESVF